MTRASDTARLISGGAAINEASNDVDFRIESNGNANMLFVDGGDDAVVIGHNASRKTLFNTTATAALQIEGTSGNTAAVSIARNSNDDNGPQLVLAKSNGTAGAAVTVVTDAALLGRISWQGADGSQTVEGARIEAFVDGTPGADDMPGRLTFSTTADGASSVTERMRINSAGAVSIGTSASVNNAPLLIHCASDDNIRIKQETHASIQGVNDAENAFVALKIDGNDLLLNSQSGNNVGIGTDSPTNTSGYTTVNIGAGSTGSILKIDGAASGFYHRLINNNGDFGIQADQGNAKASTNITFSVDGSEAMRVDSNKFFMVGKTAQGIASAGFEAINTGQTSVTQSGASPLRLNRLSDDGDLIQFRKDTTIVGSIGVSGNGIYFGDEGDTGIAFDSNSDAITPLNPTTRAVRDDAMDVGTSTARFDDIRATNGTIQTSDKNEKNTIVDSDLGIDFVNLLTPKSYKFNNKTRTHYGLIAQDVETVLGDVKKDASQFAGFCKDDISEKQDGSEYRYGLRYHEFISPMIQAIKDLKAEVDTLKAKVATLESK